MTNGFYDNVAEKYGINIIIPDNDKQDFIHDKYMTELVFNKIVPETKERLIQIIKELKEKESIEGLILGGTELPLILKQSDFENIKIFNTTEIHVESIVAKMVEN
jgi:aspartate racemase